MGMFDGILGGVVGAEMATVVNGLIQTRRYTRHRRAIGAAGIGRHSALMGGNRRKSTDYADQIHQAFGADTVKNWPRKSVCRRRPGREAVSGSTQAIDKLTPAGAVPKA